MISCCFNVGITTENCSPCFSLFSCLKQPEAQQQLRTNTYCNECNNINIMNNATTMMQSLTRRCIILPASLTSSKISSTMIRCTSSIAATSSWERTNYSKHHYCQTPLSPLPTIATQQLQLSSFSSSSGNATKKNDKKKMIPRKAALHLTPKAREIFRKLIEATGSEGIKLKYEMSSQHALRMAFKFDLIKDAKKELSFEDEG